MKRHACHVVTVLAASPGGGDRCMRRTCVATKGVLECTCKLMVALMSKSRGRLVNGKPTRTGRIFVHALQRQFKKIKMLRERERQREALHTHTRRIK